MTITRSRVRAIASATLAVALQACGGANEPDAGRDVRSDVPIADDAPTHEGGVDGATLDASTHDAAVDGDAGADSGAADAGPRPSPVCAGLIAWQGRLAPTHVRWSPTGDRVALVNGTVIMVVDAATRRVMRSIEEPGDFLYQIKSLDWSPDGTTIAVGMRISNTESRVRLYRVADGSVLGDAPVGGNVGMVAFSPDGRRIATGYSGQFGPAVVDTATFAVFEARTEHSRPASYVAWSPDGTRLASADADSVVIWDTASWTALSRVMPGVAGSLGAPRTPLLAWTRDGARLVAANGTSVRVWNAMTGTLERTLTAPAMVLALSVHPSSGRVAVSTTGTRVVAWRLSDGAMDADFAAHTRGVADLAWSPSGGSLATVSTWADGARFWADGAWTAPEWEMTGGLLERARHLAWSPDGSHLLAGIENGDVVVFSPTGEIVRRLPTGTPTGAASVAYASSGTRFATTGPTGVTLWDPATWTSTRTVSLGEHARLLSFSPNGQWLAAAVSGARVHVLETTSWTTVATLSGHDSQVVDMSWAADSGTLGTVDNTPTDNIKFWSTSSWTEVRSGGPARSVNSGRFDSSGSRFTAGDMLGNVWTFEASTWESVGSAPGRHRVPVHALSWNVGDRFLATAARDVFVSAGTVADPSSVRFELLGGEVHDLAWSPDGTALAAAGDDGVMLRSCRSPGP